MSLSRLHLVSVDVTNTLIKVNGSPGYQYSKVAQRFGIDVDQKLLSDIWLQKYQGLQEKYPNFGATDKMPADTWWTELVKECFHAVDSNIDETALDKTAHYLYHTHFLSPTAWQILPGAFHAMKDLSQYSVKTAVVSNFDSRLPSVLKSLELLHFFDFVLPSYSVGVQKPNPAIFHQALLEANCKPEEGVHIGDSEEKDYFGALSAGMESYLLSKSGEKTALVDKKHVVPDMQTFVDTIRPRLGDRLDANG